jgi:predicted dehydrogenase/threonine dehydrogenase-like Zn-dependent dehydrogenase
MKQVLLKNGRAIVDEVPTPQVDQDRILVQVDHSCISIGTELSGLKMSGIPLWQRALKQPENVKKVLQLAANVGIKKTYSVVSGQLNAGFPTGYSAAGTVIEVGSNIKNFKIGDRIACAGAQCAHHAEFISVPSNLAVIISETTSFAEASTVTLGAIALQGVRRATPTLGETFVVIGLGILGQLTAQLLKANGCRVIGCDIDVARIDLALSLGMEFGLTSDDQFDHIARLTDGIGVDGVIITAATPSNEIISHAFKFCRKKGRVVLVGDVGLDINRADIYQKELDFFVSCSYGPGRYDQNYEEKNIDYPVAYVRWTENRNMAEYLRCVAENNINIKPLIAKTFPIDAAEEAYDLLQNSTTKPLMVLLHYPNANKNNSQTILNPKAKSARQKQIRIAVIGAGNFAKSMHLPNLEKLSQHYHIHAIMSRNGHNAMATAKQFQANYATTDYQQILTDPNVDAEELEKIISFYENSAVEKSLPILLTGFNRRFSPYIQKIKESIAQRTNPMILNYRMNAGFIALDHWVHGAEGGGRNIGEACHIYDLFTYLTNSQVLSVNAQSITPKNNYYSAGDNFITTMTFADGSIATLTYTALGSKNYPKEQLEIFVDGKVITLNDYKSLKIAGAKTNEIKANTVEKGQKQELIAFAHAIQNGGEWPIPLWQQVQAMQIALHVEAFIKH